MFATKKGNTIMDTGNSYDKELCKLQREVFTAFTRLENAVKRVQDYQQMRDLFAATSADYQNLTAELEAAQTEMSQAAEAYTGTNVNYHHYALVNRADFDKCKNWGVVQETTFLSLTNCRKETYQVIMRILQNQKKLR